MMRVDLRLRPELFRAESVNEGGNDYGVDERFDFWRHESSSLIPAGRPDFGSTFAAGSSKVDGVSYRRVASIRWALP
jgi:hypothetical protein